MPADDEHAVWNCSDCDVTVHYQVQRPWGPQATGRAVDSTDNVYRANSVLVTLAVPSVCTRMPATKLRWSKGFLYRDAAH
jgi:hypothetical protein